MAENENAQKNNETITATEKPVTATPVPQGKGHTKPERGPRDFRKNERSRKPRKGGKPKERREFDQKIINIRRVARVVAGGRRFSFSVAIVIGDRKGRVGVGTGKAGDTSLAIDKAVRDARKNMITVRRTKDNSIRHDVFSKYAAAQVSILPARGRGLVAGSSVRNVLELGGVTNVTAKIFSRSKNQLNNARAAVLALKTLK